MHLSASELLYLPPKYHPGLPEALLQVRPDYLWMVTLRLAATCISPAVWQIRKYSAATLRIILPASAAC